MGTLSCIFDQNEKSPQLEAFYNEFEKYQFLDNT